MPSRPLDAALRAIAETDPQALAADLRRAADAGRPLRFRSQETGAEMTLDPAWALEPADRDPAPAPA